MYLYISYEFLLHLLGFVYTAKGDDDDWYAYLCIDQATNIRYYIQDIPSLASDPSFPLSFMTLEAETPQNSRYR